MRDCRCAAHLTLTLAWLINVLVPGCALAIFEIVLEKDKGWASALNPAGFGRRLFEGSIVARLCEKPYITVYHVFMFTVVVPAIFLSEYMLLRSGAVDTQVFGKLGPFPCGPTGSALFIVSVWLCFLAVEDFLWFALNWYYPQSLRDLLSGRIWWHTRWLEFGWIKLPRFYVSLVALSILFLLASFYAPN